MVGPALEVMGAEEHPDLVDLEVGPALEGWAVMLLGRTLLLVASTRVG